MNDEKFEFVIIGQKHLTDRITGSKSIKIGSSSIESANCVKNIGAMIDSQLDMKAHVNYISKLSYGQLRKIGHIRPNITDKSAATLVHAFISSRLDNLNSLLVGMPDYMIRKLQMIQNNAARLVLRKRKCDHVTPLLRQLHWLPVKFRIKFKICLLVFKALNGLAPSYIRSMLTLYEPGRNLRSAGRQLLKPKVARLTKTGGRAFSVCAPTMWNSLPEDLRKCSSINGFKSGLKTFLFREAFD